MKKSASSPEAANGYSCSPPGSSFSEQSLEFYKDPVAFFEKRRRQHKCSVFNARILMRTSTFVGSNAGVRHILFNQPESFNLGYKDYFSHIYGDVILFTEDVSAQDTRCVLQTLMHTDALDCIVSRITDMAAHFFNNLNIHEPVCVYSMYKQLSSEIMICTFLDLNVSTHRSLVDQIIALSVTHWHGLISVPLTWKLPFSSGCRKALDAKDKLLAIVRDLWDRCSNRDSFLHHFKQMPFSSEEVALDHLVLLITALVPKAFASLLTSCLSVSGSWEGERGSDGSLEKSTLEMVLMEAGRLWPPFVGGRRISKEPVEIDGCYIPAGRPIIYMSHPAHRDPMVFTEPKLFKWTRWKHENKFDRDKLFFFGGGSRSCVGQSLANRILTEIMTTFLKQFDFRFISDTCLEYKWLPVCRPKVKAKVLLTKRN